MKIGCALLALVSFLAGCGGNSPLAPTAAPTPVPRVTETLHVNAWVYPDGGIGYPSFPMITVRAAGLLEATATFSPTADCRFVFDVCQGNCQFSVLSSEPGVGPTLSVRGTVSPGVYNLLLGARRGGVPLCSTVPPGGLPLPFEITVTHP